MKRPATTTTRMKKRPAMKQRPATTTTTTTTTADASTQTNDNEEAVIAWCEGWSHGYNSASMFLRGGSSASAASAGAPITHPTNTQC